jgi:aconitate hydratase
MGVLPLQFPDGVSAQTLKLDGSETFDFLGLSDADIKPQQSITMVIHRGSGAEERVELKSRIDTGIEVDYYRHGGILPYVLREIVAKQ